MQCTSGSTKLPSAPAYFQFDSTTVATFMPFGAALAWLGFLDLPAGPVDTVEFCSTEPPDTTLSAADIALLGIPVLAKISGAYERLGNFIRQQAFSTYCACNGTSTSTYSAEVLALNPRWFYKMGEAAGVSAPVDSGPNHKANGFTTSTGARGAALVSGDPSTSFVFGTGDRTQLSVSNQGGTFTGAADASTEFWVNITSLPAADSTLFSNYISTNPLVVLIMHSNGKVQLQTRDSVGTQVNSADSVAALSTGVHQFDIVFDHAAHTATLYVDAAVACTCSGLSTNTYTDSTADIDVGKNNHATQNGVAGNYGLWSWFDYKLSSAQISDLKAAAGSLSIYQPPTYTPPTDGTPPTATAPTCSTNQDVCNQLQITNYLLQGVAIALNNFQKRTTPYQLNIASTSLVGLTGAGSIAVSDIVGVTVEMTTIPTKWGFTGETPKRYVPTLGTVHAKTGSDDSDWHQLHYANNIVLFDAPWASVVDYWFAPGVVATLRTISP